MNRFLFIHSSVDDARLTPSEFRLLGNLSRRAGKNGKIYSSIADMSGVCGLAPNTIKIVLKSLTRQNIIVSEQQKGKSATARRRINHPSEWRLDPARIPTQHEKRAGLENSARPSTENVPQPGTKNVPQRKSKEGNPIEGNPELPFVSAAFSSAWADWLEHQKQKGRNLTEKAREAQLKICIEWGEQRSIASIRYSIAGNCQNLFEPTAQLNGDRRREAHQKSPALRKEHTW